MPETRLPLVFDSTVLSNFASTNQMPLLERLYPNQANTTLMVVEEINSGLRAGYRYLQSVIDVLVAPRSAGWLHMLTFESSVEQDLYLHLSSSLGLGEASCLAVAIERGMVLATDDLACRRRAAEHDVRITGTVGILIRLVREKHLSLGTANESLSQMIAQRYRAPVDKLDDLI